MHDEGYRSLRLVTSWYHMRRSLLEFGRAMPRITIVAHPVFAHHVDPEGWLGSHGAISIVVGEYHKYLAASLGRCSTSPFRRRRPCRRWRTRPWPRRRRCRRRRAT